MNKRGDADGKEVTQLGRCCRREGVASQEGHQEVILCRCSRQGSVKAGRCCRHGGEAGWMVQYAWSVTGILRQKTGAIISREAWLPGRCITVASRKMQGCEALAGREIWQLGRRNMSGKSSSQECAINREVLQTGTQSAGRFTQPAGSHSPRTLTT